MNIHSDKAFNIYPPNNLLSKYVLFYNIFFPKQNMFAKHYTLMPDACGTLTLAYDGNNILAEIWGASITSTMLGAEPNKYEVMLLIQFSPYGLYQITHYNQAEFADKRMSLKDVDSELYHSLCCAFMTADDITGLLKICDKILYNRIKNHIVSDALLSATKIISDNNGQILVGELAKHVGYSERHLNRIFLGQIGMNIKNYTRLIRFNYALSYIQKSPCFFSALSQQAGYYDQPHFNKDFKSISGLTPQDYLHNMSDFYYGTPILSDILYPKE